eukprot:snap_masked-scaffold_4-processed-gene-20.3-mRNA-1 protein AED:1.00 eAED:1.00 QI:0/0/0/0/1/1/3/0/1473
MVEEEYILKDDEKIKFFNETSYDKFGMLTKNKPKSILFAGKTFHVSSGFPSTSEERKEYKEEGIIKDIIISYFSEFQEPCICVLQEKTSVVRVYSKCGRCFEIVAPFQIEKIYSASIGILIIRAMALEGTQCEPWIFSAQSIDEQVQPVAILNSPVFSAAALKHYQPKNCLSVDNVMEAEELVETQPNIPIKTLEIFLSKKQVCFEHFDSCQHLCFIRSVDDLRSYFLIPEVGVIRLCCNSTGAETKNTSSLSDPGSDHQNKVFGRKFEAKVNWVLVENKFKYSKPSKRLQLCCFHGEFCGAWVAALDPACGQLRLSALDGGEETVIKEAVTSIMPTKKTPELKLSNLMCLTETNNILIFEGATCVKCFKLPPVQNRLTRVYANFGNNIIVGNEFSLKTISLANDRSDSPGIIEFLTVLEHYSNPCIAATCSKVLKKFAEISDSGKQNKVSIANFTHLLSALNGWPSPEVSPATMLKFSGVLSEKIISVLLQERQILLEIFVVWACDKLIKEANIDIELDIIVQYLTFMANDIFCSTRSRKPSAAFQKTLTPNNIVLNEFRHPGVEELLYLTTSSTYSPDTRSLGESLKLCERVPSAKHVSCLVRFFCIALGCPEPVFECLKSLEFNEYPQTKSSLRNMQSLSKAYIFFRSKEPNLPVCSFSKSWRLFLCAFLRISLGFESQYIKFLDICWFKNFGKNAKSGVRLTKRPTEPNVLEILAQGFKDTRATVVSDILSSAVRKTLFLKENEEVTDLESQGVQQIKIFILCERTLALSLGRGAFYFASSSGVTSLAQGLSIPAIKLEVVASSNQAVKTLDTSNVGLLGYVAQSTSLPREVLSLKLLCWPQFHNGVASALELKSEDKLNVHPIFKATFQNLLKSLFDSCRTVTGVEDATPQPHVYEKAGFLLGLGLSGKIRLGRKSVTKHYLISLFTLAPTITHIACILGLSASYYKRFSSIEPISSWEGTNLMKIIAVHIPSFLPPTTGKLQKKNVSETMELISVFCLGLIFAGTGNDVALKYLYSRLGIGTLSGACEGKDPETKPDDVTRRVLGENYALVIAFSSGLIEKEIHSSGSATDETRVPPIFKALQKLLWRKAPENKKTFYRGSSQINKGGYTLTSVENNLKSCVHYTNRTKNLQINRLATMLAIGLACFNCNHYQVSIELDLPTYKGRYYKIRPDCFAYQILSRCFIHWAEVKPTSSWIHSQVPNSNLYQSSAEYPTTVRLYLFSGLCFSIGLKFAGTKNPQAQSTLLGFLSAALDSFDGILTTENPFNVGKCCSTTQFWNSLKFLIIISALSVACVMSGTGDLETLRIILRTRFHLRNESENVKDKFNYGTHQASNLALGILFLGGCKYKLNNDKKSVVLLTMSLFPVWPQHSIDNIRHNQIFRHLYTLCAVPNTGPEKQLSEEKVEMKKPRSLVHAGDGCNCGCDSADACLRVLHARLVSESSTGCSVGNITRLLKLVVQYQGRAKN